MKNAIDLCVTKGNKMVVISCKAIRDFTEKNRDVEDGYNVIEKADFANLAEIKHMFNSVDYVGCNLYVFNIKGNHYRLIARIHFAVRTVYIKFIGTHKEYDALMLKIDALMRRDEKDLTDKERNELRSMALAAQMYEKSIYTIPAPSTIEGMIELKMYEQKLKQRELAKLLGTGEAKLSQILTGKRKPDVPFLKAAYLKLKIDPGFLLEHASV